MSFQASKQDIVAQDRRAIEVSFPFVEISQLAERESYRKEIFRPIYHIHKWWATRLGSVFRAMVLGAILNDRMDIWQEFYKTNNSENIIVLDPFMGSGTTLGEAAKLGAKPIGCDINPISTFIVRQALTPVSVEELKRIYEELEKSVKHEIAQYYTTLDPESGKRIPVMYYFWVTLAETPEGETIPLFRSYVFSKNAYPKKKPIAKIICPSCWKINSSYYNIRELQCNHCGYVFDPQHGPAKGQYVTDEIGMKHKIIELLQRYDTPPKYRLYALIALRPNGEKVYLEPTEFDFNLFEEAKERLLAEELPLPTMAVRSGYNTDQARKYNYTEWRNFFNERQLLCLGLLLKHILDIEHTVLKDHFLTLFSSTLEFNNMFCSFKGEGTGAVRHMFSHHVLKPERTPLENSIWGTPNSSGTFASLFRSRLIKAKQYLDAPFELYLQRDLFGEIGKSKAQYFVASDPLRLNIAESWEEFCNTHNGAMILNGNSSDLPIPDETVDLVITDPPYFDFVHYSELSDFFFAWLAPVLSDRYAFFDGNSSFNDGEVQSNDHNIFSKSLANVFSECHRVLKPDGLLCFSFHHSRPQGWISIYRALLWSEFQVIATYPVHGEMKVSSPKSNTKEPISIDMLLICRKQHCTISNSTKEVAQSIEHEFTNKLNNAGIKLSKADLFNLRASLGLMIASQKETPVLDYRKQLEQLTK